MRKISKVLLLAFIFSIAFTAITFAKVTTLWRISDETYITSEHGDEWWADTYYGVVSVRGTDRFWQDGKNRYVVWARLTYDVQGKKSSITAYSKGKNNPEIVVKKITVKDKWNFGTKTKAMYSVRAAVADGNTYFKPKSSDDYNFGGTVVLE